MNGTRTDSQARAKVRVRQATTVVLQLAMPHYRQGLVNQLGSDDSIVFLTGDRQFQEGVTVDVSGSNVIRTGKNRFLFGRRLAFQPVPLSIALQAPTLVVELNPRVINSWLYLGMRKLLRKPTVAWGHVFPRAGRGAGTDRLRQIMRRMLDGMIVYTQGEQAEFATLHPRIPVYVAANAVYSRSELTPAIATDTRDSFIVIGRLVEAKRPQLALQAMQLLIEEVPDARLVVVGSGPLLTGLRSSWSSLVESGHVMFTGDVMEIEDLRPLFSRAIALLGPGYVGLNVTQALGFGVPVIYADDEPHAPEVELLDSSNSTAFSAGNPSELAQAMADAWRARAAVDLRLEERSRPVRERYSVEAMADAFRQVAQFEMGVPGLG